MASEDCCTIHFDITTVVRMDSDHVHAETKVLDELLLSHLGFLVALTSTKEVHTLVAIQEVTDLGTLVDEMVEDILHRFVLGVEVLVIHIHLGHPSILDKVLQTS